jgi:uridine phosphorylase
MAFPQYSGKHGLTPYLSPAKWLAYLRETHGWEGIPQLSGVILTFSPAFFDRVAAGPGWYELRSPLTGPGGFYVLGEGAQAVGMVGRFGIGAPAAANLLEDLVAAGVGRFVAIGLAGALQPEMRIGDLVVCSEAVRDDGVSHHYLPGAARALPSPDLTDQLAGELARSERPPRRGPTWTIDAPYRETVEEIQHYRELGVLTVEMEAAALAAVAEVRGVQFAAAFAVSDSLAGDSWSPHFADPSVDSGLDLLLEAAVLALRTDPAQDGAAIAPEERRRRRRDR